MHATCSLKEASERAKKARATGKESAPEEDDEDEDEDDDADAATCPLDCLPVVLGTFACTKGAAPDEVLLDENLAPNEVGPPT